MQDTIAAKLKEIEEVEKVRILYAVESGSRAWGFASPDSDYDVRFLYVRPIEEYLRLDAQRDVIEYELNEVLDICGWDIRKALTLAYKSNPTLFEWINSPLVYLTTETFEKRKNDLLAYFQKKQVLYHYGNLARKHYLRNFKGGTVKLKAYLYVIRAILAFKWTAKKDSLPPVKFRELVNSQLEESLLREMDALLKQKVSRDEGDKQGRVLIWDNWIEENIEIIESTLLNIEADQTHEWDGLNQLFLEFIYGY